MHNAFGACDTLEAASGAFTIYRLDALEKAGLGSISHLPFSIKVLLEAALRNVDGFAITEEHVRTLAGWKPDTKSNLEIPFMPARVLMQDFTGVPAVVDLAALRSAIDRLGGDPNRINPHVPVDLVIDHSVQIDAFGSAAALNINSEREFERNRERYEFLRWGQGAFDDFRVVPPASGIVHQVNLEHLATVVQQREEDGAALAYPDTLVGTDSHTTMVNGLGVLGWGVGGIEAEAVILGQPVYLLMPEVVGVRLTGALPEGATATDLVLIVTELLRQHGVVGKFVEYFGDGMSRLSLPDRATLANMSPEYGATMGFFPVDDETLRFLRRTGRSANLVDLVERYCREQGLFRTDVSPEPQFSDTLELDMSTVEPSLAGPKRPQDRVPLRESKARFRDVLKEDFGIGAQPLASRISHGSVVIASITSCTNTSNPSVMIGAGLLAKKAVDRGLSVKPWVKTSMAPGSRVVTRYLEASGLLPFLEALRFHVVGYGCTTCIGNSGPLPEEVAIEIEANDLVACAVLSGNRNFEGRISPMVRANYLASPPLVVAYAIAGTMDIDLAAEPLGHGPNGTPVYLAEIWPSQSEIADALATSLAPEMFRSEYAHIFKGSETWRQISAGGGVVYGWDPKSTYIQEPPFFKGLTPELPPVSPIAGARVLALLGDTVTTDHISPAGAFSPRTPAGQHLIARGVEQRDFNSYGSRRGNHEVMLRGTFANIRLRNLLAPGTEGGYTTHLPSGEVTTIYEAAMRYKAEGTPLVVLAGKEYGTGSSRDWAAKGTYLLGVKAVIAESYERIHRANLIGMGVLPLQFEDGDGWRQLELTGHERIDLDLPEALEPGQVMSVRATTAEGEVREFEVISRLDSPVEVRYFRNGGILHTVLRDMLRQTGA